MLSAIRKFLDTRYAKLFFVLLIIPFVLWGIAGVANNAGSSGTAIANVGSQSIEPPAFQQAYRQMLTQVTRQMGITADPTPAIKRGVAQQALERLIIQAAIADEVKRLGLVVPDESLRKAVFEIPAFKGRSGAFDRTTFEQVLRQNNLTEGRFLELMRADIGQRQLMEAVQLGATTPTQLLHQVFAFQREQRVAELVELPFSAAPEPAPPTIDDLRRAYADDPQRYAAPAYRRIKAVILSPDTIARSAEVPDADIAAYYEQHKTEFGSTEKRSLQVIVAQDEPAAQKLAAEWIAGADWTALQKASTDAGASAVALDDATRLDIPAPELAEAAFAAPPGTVTGPIRSAFGWQVFRVTKLTPGTEQPLAAVQDQVRLKLARERAVDEVYGRANKLEDQLSAGMDFDHVPSDLGVAGLAGTLDARGNTPEGEPAPLPGSPALRQAILIAAFAAKKGDPAKMIEGPDQSYFALTVEDETPPQVKPFETIEAQLRDDYLHDARRHAQEVVAAKLLAAIKAGASLDDAATVAGVRTERTPPIVRGQPTEGIPTELVQPLFGMKLNDGTMLERPDGFLVAKLVGIASPDPATDPIGASQMKTALDRSMSQDLEMTYAAALRDRAKPTVNQAAIETLIQ